MKKESLPIIFANDYDEFNLIAKLKERSEGISADVEKKVKEIIDDVRANGDEAVKKYTLMFDNVELKSMRVSKKRIRDDYYECGLSKNLQVAYDNIMEYHKHQKKDGFMINENGKILGQRVLPLERVGIYVPGGTAGYPSTVLMAAIPAIVAGVKEIVLCTPEPKERRVRRAVFAAAHMCGIEEIYTIGGAQAIAAMAYGTETVKKVDKIVGPGNIFVAMAKKLVYGQVDIDSIAGPSEILIIADEKADPEYIAADLLSQAEHDKLASSILLTTSEVLAKKVRLQVSKQLKDLDRKEIAQQALLNQSVIIVTKDIDYAIKLANLIAPEHLELMIDDPMQKLGDIKNAGSVFLGKYSPEPLGDYLAGPNHILPTMGTSRFFSPLSVDSFQKKSSYIYYSQDALRKVGKDIIAIAKQEGLGAHANAVDKRL